MRCSFSSECWRTDLCGEGFQPAQAQCFLLVAGCRLRRNSQAVPESNLANTLDATAVAVNPKRPLSATDNGRLEGWLNGLEPPTPRSTIWRTPFPTDAPAESCGDDEFALHQRLHQKRSQTRKTSAGGGSVPSKSDSQPIKADSFSAALAMIASLPLSDAEKAEAVRRLMAEHAGSPEKNRGSHGLR